MWELVLNSQRVGVEQKEKDGLEIEDGLTGTVEQQRQKGSNDWFQTGLMHWLLQASAGVIKSTIKRRKEKEGRGKRESIPRKAIQL